MELPEKVDVLGTLEQIAHVRECPEELLDGLTQVRDAFNELLDAIVDYRKALQEFANNGCVSNMISHDRAEERLDAIIKVVTPDES